MQNFGIFILVLHTIIYLKKNKQENINYKEKNNNNKIYRKIWRQKKMSNYYNKAYLEINYLVDQIKSLDIEEVIGRHLERKGRDYLCPFHNDIKGESFKILKQTNTYKCYSCGESGDAINFFQNMFNLTFKDAVLMIADEQGLYHSNDYLKTDRSYQVRKKES